MKVKKYLKPEKEVDGRGPHKSLCRSSKRHVCQNCPDDVFLVHNRNKHHPCKIPSKDQCCNLTDHIGLPIIHINNIYT